jgi:hypothetical protein
MTNTVPYAQSPFNKSRKDKFLLVLNFPDSLKSISKKIERNNVSILPDSIQFSVYGAIVPDIDIPATNIPYAGQTYVASSHVRPPYAACTVNFTIDNRFNNYWAIYKWLNILNDSKTGLVDNENILATAKTNNLKYAADISIFALDEYDKRVVEFVYNNAFPTSLGGIDFNNRDGGEIETSFTFNYSKLLVSLVETVDSL